MFSRIKMVTITLTSVFLLMWSVNGKKNGWDFTEGH